MELRTVVDQCLELAARGDCLKEMYGQIGDAWDVSHMNDMSRLFMEKILFNSDISNWDVSSVTTMRNMFSYSASFNHDISNMNGIQGQINNTRLKKNKVNYINVSVICRPRLSNNVRAQPRQHELTYTNTTA